MDLEVTGTDKDKKTAFYPEETLNTTEMQSATFIEKHVASLSICKSQSNQGVFCLILIFFRIQLNLKGQERVTVMLLLMKKWKTLKTCLKIL